VYCCAMSCLVFCLNEPATSEIYTRSLNDVRQLGGGGGREAMEGEREGEKFVLVEGRSRSGSDG